MNHEKFVKLWNENIPAKQIAEELKITSNYVSKYASLHRDECPIRRNKRSEILKNEVASDIAKENISDEVNLEIDTIFIDTSAIQHIKTFEIIEKAKKVLISAVVLREINRLKDKEKRKPTPLYYSIQKLLRACAMDVRNEKYSIINVEYKIGECNDENIVRTAKQVKNAIIVTSDYGLCCFCKLYNISYFLVTNNMFFCCGDHSLDCNAENNSVLPFGVVNEEDKLTITCFKGRIEVKRKETEIIINPGESSELFAGDNVVIAYKTNSHYVVKRNAKKNKTVLMPIPTH